MNDIEYISNNLQLHNYYFADCHGRTLKHNGNEVCGVCISFYTPDPVPFWFVNDSTGFRRHATPQEVIKVYNEYLKLYGNGK